MAAGTPAQLIFLPVLSQPERPGRGRNVPADRGYPGAK